MKIDRASATAGRPSSGARLRVAVVGRGNVGHHLTKAFGPVADTVTVNPRFPEESLPENVDFIILAVSDGAIGEVATKIAGLYSGCACPVLVHTSGSMSLEVLDGWVGPRGVLYPLQTFSRGRELDYSAIPFFVEGDSQETALCIEGFAGLVSRRVDRADSNRRRVLHLGAVFACNFANALWGMADDILKEAGYGITDMLPLIGETVAKLRYLTPVQAQTGPASRGDTAVLARQERELASRPELQEVYRMLSRVISERKTRY